jgi:crossover junction endodeoxyribonuclease RusA
MNITVYGIPAPQGSKKFVGVSKVGRGILIESSKAVKPWREAVKWAALETLKGLPLRPDGKIPFMYDCAVSVSMIFSLPKPPSAPKKRRWPDRKPDLSKLIRSTEDALTDAGVWVDDARVVAMTAAKVYVGSTHLGALDRPGATIIIQWADDGACNP